MIKIPSFLGQPIYVWTGIILFILVVLQIFIAKKWLPLNFRYHRYNGWIILFFALGHGLAAIAAYFLGAPVQGF